MFSGQVLTWRREVKQVIEDGYLEYSLGSDGVFLNNILVRGYYMGGQFDRIGSCFIKGFVFLIIFLLSYRILRF